MRRTAFTLIEVLVVLAIIAVLTGLLLGAIQKVRSAAARADCQNRLKQITLAAVSAHDTQRHFPTGRVPLRTPFVAGEWTGSGWPTQLLPHLEQSALFGTVGPAFAQTFDISEQPPHVGMATVVKAFLCPTDGRITQPITPSIYTFPVAFTSYVGVSGTRARRADGVFYNDSRTRIADIADGNSNTLLFGERPPDAPYHFWSPHSGGANFAFADGSVRFLSYAAAPVMPALSTRAGGEAVEVP